VTFIDGLGELKDGFGGDHCFCDEYEDVAMMNALFLSKDGGDNDDECT
jgi:hypothetical protein